MAKKSIAEEIDALFQAVVKDEDAPWGMELHDLAMYLSTNFGTHAGDEHDALNDWDLYVFPDKSAIVLPANIDGSKPSLIFYRLSKTTGKKNMPPGFRQEYDRIMGKKKSRRTK